MPLRHLTLVASEDDDQSSTGGVRRGFRSLCQPKPAEFTFFVLSSDEIHNFIYKHNDIAGSAIHCFSWATLTLAWDASSIGGDEHSTSPGTALSTAAEVIRSSSFAGVRTLNRELLAFSYHAFRGTKQG